MAKIAIVTECPPADHLPHNILETKNSQGTETPPNGEELMEQILASLLSKPQEDVLKRIASLPRARQNMVLTIRHRITEGTYEVKDRLNEAMDMVLDIITD